VNFLVRNLLALARVQPAAVPVIERLELGRVAALERLADRLHQAGRLRDGLTRPGAVDLLLVITALPPGTSSAPPATAPRRPPPRPSPASPSGP
jgi:hypothetical protein